MRQNLEFRGGWSDLFGDILVTFFLGTLTLGIYVPWGIARLRRTIASHTYYHDRPLEFDGTGGQLFGLYLKILLLSLITLGIYALLCFPAVAWLKWDAAHTILPNGKRLEYRGTALDLFGDVLVVAILTSITLGIYSFWGVARIYRHVTTHTTVDGQPLQFTGTGGQYFEVALVNWFLTLITLGIYDLLGCAMVRELRWSTENTVLPLMQEASPPTTTPTGGRPIQVTVTIN